MKPTDVISAIKVLPIHLTSALWYTIWWIINLWTVAPRRSVLLQPLGSHSAESCHNTSRIPRRKLNGDDKLSSLSSEASTLLHQRTQRHWKDVIWLFTVARMWTKWWRPWYLSKEASINSCCPVIRLSLMMSWDYQSEHKKQDALIS